MSDATTNLQLPYLAPAQAQKHVTVNEAFARLDALVHLTVASRSVTAQPATPADGVVYLVPPGKSGAAWSAMADGALAAYRDGAWEAITPRPGWSAFVLDEARRLVFRGGVWRAELAAIPAGLVMLSAAAAPPPGFVRCDGRTLSRTANADLFAAIGVTYGAGDGATTFATPDLRSRDPATPSGVTHVIALGG